jgi:hypothetical protein
MQAWSRFVVCVSLGALALGCSSSGDGGMGGAGGAGGFGVDLPTAEAYYPQKVGNSWTYLVTPTGVDLPSYKVVTIEAVEMVGGDGTSAVRPAYRHATCKSAPSVAACAMPPSATNRVDKTVGWLGMVDKTLGNYREQSFKKGTEMMVEEDWWEPYRIKIDNSPAHTTLGATWTDSYKEWKRPVGGITTSTPQNETWTVLAVDDTVTITPPGGAPRSYPHCLKVTHSNNSGSMNKAFWYARGIGKVKETGTQIEELIDYKVQP